VQEKLRFSISVKVHAANDVYFFVSVKANESVQPSLPSSSPVEDQNEDDVSTYLNLKDFAVIGVIGKVCQPACRYKGFSANGAHVI